MATGLAPLQGTLYIVATPIGNREDITLRALRVLREVAVVAAENGRHTRAMLAHHGITTPTLSYREGNKATSTAAILDLLQTKAVALVSDAGLPAISDPGGDLIGAVIERGGRVEVVPGPSAVLTALIVSGLPAAPFTFVGFLSRQRGDRRREIARLAAYPETLVFYEAPHRLLETLDDLQAGLGDRRAAVARELTKLHEETLRGPLSALQAHFRQTPPRGEFVVVVAGAEPLENARSEWTVERIDGRLGEAIARGEDMRAAVATLAVESGQPRRTIYARWQALRKVGSRQ